MDDNYLTARESMAYLKLGRHTFYASIVHDESVPRLRVGTRIVFRRCDLDAWAGRNLVAGDDPRAVLANRGRGYRGQHAEPPAGHEEAGGR